MALNEGWLQRALERAKLDVADLPEWLTSRPASVPEALPPLTKTASTAPPDAATNRVVPNGEDSGQLTTYEAWTNKVPVHLRVDVEARDRARDAREEFAQERIAQLEGFLEVAEAREAVLRQQLATALIVLQAYRDDLEDHTSCCRFDTEGVGDNTDVVVIDDRCLICRSADALLAEATRG